MISATQIKFIKSLHQKKSRIESKMFIAEGVKVVNDLILQGFNVKEIYATASYIHKYKSLISEKPFMIYEISDTQLERISTLSTPNEVVAICGMGAPDITPDDLKNKWCIVLDGINDPGNLGTIIRTAHWFGIDTIICSQNSVDIYNPKTVQSTMGSLAAVTVIYADLTDLLCKLAPLVSIFGTTLEGCPYRDYTYPKKGILLFGSESHGINADLYKYVHHKIVIPPVKPNNKPDSLNIAVSSGIILSELSSQKCL